MRSSIIIGAVLALAVGTPAWACTDISSKTVKLSAGIDNLFDKTYAEAISRGGANVSGYDTTFRINEPGRTLWLKLTWR